MLGQQAAEGLGAGDWLYTERWGRPPACPCPELAPEAQDGSGQQQSQAECGLLSLRQWVISHSPQPWCLAQEHGILVVQRCLALCSCGGSRSSVFQPKLTFQLPVPVGLPPMPAPCSVFLFLAALVARRVEPQGGEELGSRRLPPRRPPCRFPVALAYHHTASFIRLVCDTTFHPRSVSTVRTGALGCFLPSRGHSPQPQAWHTVGAP